MRPAFHHAIRSLPLPPHRAIRLPYRQIATALAIVEPHILESVGGRQELTRERREVRTAKPKPTRASNPRRQLDLAPPAAKYLPSINEAAWRIRALQDEEGDNHVRRQEFPRNKRRPRCRVVEPWGRYSSGEEQSMTAGGIPPQRQTPIPTNLVDPTLEYDYAHPQTLDGFNTSIPRSRTNTPFYDVDWRPLIGSHSPNPDMPKYLELTLVCDPLGLPPSIYSTLVHLGFRYQNQTMVHRLTPKVRKQIRTVESLLFVRPMSKTKMRIAKRLKRAYSARRRQFYPPPKIREMQVGEKGPPLPELVKKGKKGEGNGYG
ncbi:hypothetical protein FRB95_005878 [Tulasnella sp. JGI-2019a]|nr:hypothetical protein FRB95_005878 [Tulasnella sp. JGI-2019a]